MNYLGQPVFLSRPNWSNAVARSVKFELRPEDIGFGVEYFTPTASWTVNEWKCEFTLADAATLKAFDDFFAGLKGRLQGFWLPVPVAAGRITAAASTSVFSIEDEDLATYWNDRPDVYLFFDFADGTQAAAKIQSVVSAGATETVTLTAALPQAPDANTAISRLHFVRLAGDEEEGEFIAEGMMQRKLAVVEIPSEYAAAALGLQPIYLFHFFAPAPALGDWYFTSFSAPVVSNNQLYQNFPINFSNLVDTSDGSVSELKIEAKPDPANPLMLFLPFPFSATLFVEIFAVDYNDADTQTLLFSGRVISVEDGGSKLTASCENRLGYLKRKLPRFLKGPTCQNTLYDAATCKALRAIFETSIVVTAVSDAVTFPPTVTGTFLLPDFADKFKAANYLAGGLFECGVGQSYEARTIVKSTFDAGSGQLTLTLNLRLLQTQPGVNAQVVAGCDRTAATCKARFDNYVNFGGFVAIPPRNPTLKAVNANPVSQGGK